MSDFNTVKAQLTRTPRRWLITGAAGFIGSSLVEALLKLDQRVVGLDNFATGHRKNLDEVKRLVSAEQWARFTFIDGDIRDLSACQRACAGVDYVLHQAALGSVPLSIDQPLATHASNVTGFLNILQAAREQKARRVVYASSSAIYGDEPTLPKVEDKTGRPLSPYAATKWMNEIYADTFARVYGTQAIGLRYFNVFGPRQDPDGAYAAVIPKWVAALIRHEPICINGDGETSRDFCYITNVVQANLLAAMTENPAAVNQAYNIAVGGRTTLNELYTLLRDRLARTDAALQAHRPTYQAFRPGDVRHSLADIGKAQRLLGYSPTHHIAGGLDLALDWYRRHAR